MISISEGYQTTNHSSQPTRLTKMKNVDISLRCLLLEKHESFNRNATVRWWFKKTCRISCWNHPEVDEWTQITCGADPCSLSLNLDDDTASSGFYLCKMFPYKISESSVLRIEVAKTFQLEILGKIFLCLS